MLKIWITSIVAISAQAVFGQVNNVLLDEMEAQKASLYRPSVAINSRQPDNIVVGANDQTYVSRDGGKTWTKTSLEVDGAGSPVITSDTKGDFYAFSTRASDANSNAPGGIFLQGSKDGGTTWSRPEAVINDEVKHLQRHWITLDHRGHFFATWTATEMGDDSSPDCESVILFSMSKNGKKWTDPVALSQLSGDCLQAATAPIGAAPTVTPDGKAFASWSSGGKIYLDRSFDGGSRWLNNDIEVADQAGGNALTIDGHGICNSQPVLISDNSKSSWRGSLYLVWADQRNGKDDTDIWFSRSHNFGDNWSLPLRVNNDEPGKHQYLPRITVDRETGHLYIVYYDRRNADDTATEVWLAWSTNGGGDFKNMRISESAFLPGDTENSGAYVDVAAHAGLVIPVWIAVENGKEQLWSAAIRPADLNQP